MARDPWTQHHDETAREDEDDRKRTHEEYLERLREQASMPGDGVMSGNFAAIGFDPADGGAVLTAPIRQYRCREPEHELRAFVVPKAVKDQRGDVVGYHYPVADGPFCVRCGLLMMRLHEDPVSDS